MLFIILAAIILPVASFFLNFFHQPKVVNVIKSICGLVLFTLVFLGPIPGAIHLANNPHKINLIAVLGLPFPALFFGTLLWLNRVPKKEKHPKEETQQVQKPPTPKYQHKPTITKIL